MFVHGVLLMSHRGSRERAWFSDEIRGRTRVGCFRQVLRSGYNPAEAWMLRMTLVSHGKINEVLALVK